MVNVNEHYATMIKLISENLDKDSNALLKELGVTSSQMYLLLMLANSAEQEYTLKQLEGKLRMSQPTVAGLSNRLESKDLIEGYISPDDKRVKRVRITAKGNEIYNLAVEKLERYESEKTKIFTSEEKKEFVRLLSKLYQSLG